METTKLYDVSFQGDDTIICCEMVNDREAVMLISNGHVISWNFEEGTGNYLFSAIKDNASYTDGGFDINSSCKLYVLGEIVVAVNEFKSHGYVYNRTLDRKTHISREDYYGVHSSYPIALFRNEDNVPHIIYAVAWNHVQIMNLDTMRILTADKSLIEVDAEERHRRFYEEYKNDNNLPWPSRFDYFYAHLDVSPDGNYFLSRGWCWGSADDYKIFDLQHFISNNRILKKNVMWGEHERRAACWIDNSTLAVAYNEVHNGEGDCKDTQLYIYDISGDESKLRKQIVLDVFDGETGVLHFSPSLNTFIAYAPNKGLTVADRNGNILLRDEQAKVHSFNTEHNLLVTIGGNAAFVYKIEA